MRYSQVSHFCIIGSTMWHYIALGNQRAHAALVKLGTLFKTAWAWFLGYAKPFATSLFGSWQAPVWLAVLVEGFGFAYQITLKPVFEYLGKRLLWVFIALLLGLTAWLTSQYLWTWTHGTQDDVVVTVKQVKVSLTQPSIEFTDGKAQVRPVVVDFDQDVIPIALVNKPVQNMRIEPAVEGTWQWDSLKRAVFTPTQAWKLGQSYTLRMSQDTLLPSIALNQKIYDLALEPFKVHIYASEFYQDPVQPNLRQALYSVSFNYPVDTASFEQSINLAFGKQCASSGLMALLKKAVCTPVKYKVSYDNHKLSATVESVPLTLQEEERELELSVTNTVLSSIGGSHSTDGPSSVVKIPGLNQGRVENTMVSVVSNQKGEPEQVLHLKTNMIVHEREIAKNVHVWLLPLEQNSSNPKATAPNAAAQGKQPAAYDWTDHSDQITDAVLKRAQKLAISAIASEREVTDQFAYKIPQPEDGRYILVRIGAGTKLHGGFQIGKQHQEVLALKPFAAELAFVSKGSLLSLGGDKKIAVLVRDVPGMSVEIGRLLPQQLQHLVSQSRGLFTQTSFVNGIGIDQLTERFEKNIPLKLKAGKAHYETIDFGNYLKQDAQDKRGVFVVSVSRYDPQDAAEHKPALQAAADDEGEDIVREEVPHAESDEQAAASLTDKRLIIVTDLGLLLKKNLKGEHDVFVQSIATGKPVAGAAVDIWGANGQVLASQTTDATGIAKLPNVAGFTREKAPTVIVVRKQGDMSFLPYTQKADRLLDWSRFDVGGIKTGRLPNQMSAFVFSDRGIYRPGDTMNFGVIVKATDWSKSYADVPLEYEVLDARGVLVKRDKLKLGKAGAAEFAYTTQDTSNTGTYTVNVSLPRVVKQQVTDSDALVLATSTVRVQEFLPDRTRLEAKFTTPSQKGWNKPNGLKVALNAHTLFGTPAQNRRVQAQVTLTPGLIGFEGYQNYQFDWNRNVKLKTSEQLSDTTTDNAGQTSYELALDNYEKAMYQVHVLAKVFEPEGGRSVAAEATRLVSDLDYLVGYKLDADSSYLKLGAAPKAQFIAIDPNLKKIAMTGLKLERLEQKTVSVLVKRANDRYGYESKLKDVLLDEKPLTLSEQGFTLALNTQQPGNFVYRVKDKDGVVISKLSYTVVGDANLTRSLDRNAELALSLNKTDFVAGEDIEVNIRAPYAGAGVITIEQDKVYAHAWFKTDKNSTVQKITLPKTFEGSGYVSVHFVRDIASNEIYMSPLSYGVVPFATSVAKRTAAVKLTSTELVKPGQTMKINVQTPVPSRVFVFAIDEGILQVARFKTPDPIKHFFQKRALEVSTYQTLDLILPEFNKLMKSFAPGGDAEGESGKHLNPFKRKRDKPVTYWSGLVDVNGSKDFSYTVPETFNGTMRVMAVVVNEGSVASAATKTVVRGDMVIQPNVPVALSPGDTVVVGVGLNNNIANSGKDTPIALTLAVSGGLEVVGPATQTLNTSERSESSTNFKVRAKAGADAQLGSASVVFSATYKQYSAKLSTDLSIRPASALVTHVQSGSVLGAGTLENKGTYYPNMLKQELSVSAAPWAFANSLIKYLDAYPYGCTEQITSRMYPAVLLNTRPNVADSVRKQSNISIAQQFASYLTVLRTRQTDTGGFSVWQGGGADPFMTAYVLQLLLEAQEHKLAVPVDVIESANRYLQNWLSRPANNTSNTSNTSVDDTRVRAMAVYVLTKQNILMPTEMNQLRERYTKQAVASADLGMAYLGAAYALTKQDKLGADLMQPLWSELQQRVSQKQRSKFWGNYYDPLVHDARVLQLTAKHFPARLKSLPTTTWTHIADQLQEGWYNSLSSASLMLSIDAYYEAMSAQTTGKVSATVTDSKNKASTLEFGQINPMAIVQLPADAMRLRIANAADVPVYYAWTVQGYERSTVNEAVNRGIEVYRDIVDDKDNPVSAATVGQELYVRVRVKSLNSAIPNVALVDVLPGGLEPVLQSATGEDTNNEQTSKPMWQRKLGSSGSWGIDYADIREDRVVLYGTVNTQLLDFKYKVRASNVGTFVLPASYAEAMYDRRLYSRSKSGEFTVNPK